MTQVGFPSIVCLRLRAFGAQPPSESKSRQPPLSSLIHNSTKPQARLAPAIFHVTTPALQYPGPVPFTP